MRKILLLEDDRALSMGIKYVLQSEEYTVVQAMNLKEARSILENEMEKLSLVLLDICLPDGMGFELCKEIRQKESRIPIIFLTALSEEGNVVQGLEMGADDYIVKPFRLKELSSRIRANIRRNEMSDNQNEYKKDFCINFGAYSFFMDEYRLFHGEKLVECTMSELRLLKELVCSEGKILDRNHLLQNLFDTKEVFVEDNTLSVYIKRLRIKLGEEAERIETVRGIGYRFHL